MELLERDAYLQELRECLDRCVEGQGQLVFLGGEGGIGKTSVVERFLAEVSDRARGVVISCDGLKMPGPFGAMYDIAEALGPEVEHLLATQAPRDQIFRAVLTALREVPRPLVLVGEDAHWSDEATLELVRFLGRRIGTTRAVFIVIYRDDHLGAHHPLRRTLGDLATAPAVRRVELPRLSRAAVATLAEGSGLDPDELYRRTGGNPFYVTELIGAGTMDVPPTVRDAVLARAAALSPGARALLDAIAAIGVIVNPELLAEVVGGPVEDLVEACLAVGMLRPSQRVIAFRHGIVQDTILRAMSMPRRRALHRRILAAMEARPALAKDLAHLSYHAEEAGDAEAVLRYAVAAARQAAAFRSHREAAAQYDRALRFADGLPVEERIVLMEAWSYEGYLTGDLDGAISTQAAAIELIRSTGDRRHEGDSTRWLSRYCWFAGRNSEAHRYALDAYTLLAGEGPCPELAMACSNLSQLRMLSWDLSEALEWGERAIALATELGEQAILVHARINVGTALLVLGDDRGWSVLEACVERARELGAEDDAARALTNLAWSSWSQCQLERTMRYLEEGIAYTAERDLVSMELYQRALRASVWLEQGAWDDAVAEVEVLRSLPSAALPTRIVAQTCLGRVLALRGDDPSEALDIAADLARQIGELQRVGHVAAARAEAAWLAGDLPRVVDEAHDAYDEAIARQDRWLAGQLGVWLHRAGVQVAAERMAPPFAMEVMGDVDAAARWWHEHGYRIESARALASSCEEDGLRSALEAFEANGERADAARVARQLREMGARHIPRGPRPATRANAGHLTPRELEVLRLVASGGSNREIADRLYLSPKTVGHHVSAILGKLDAASRQDAVRHAQALGLLQDREPTTPK